MKRKAIAKILISFFIILLSGCSKTKKTEMTSETIKQDSTVSEVIDEETVISHIAIEPIQFTDDNNIDYLLFDLKNNYNEALYLSIKVLFYDTNDKVIHTEDCGTFMASNQESLVRVYNIDGLNYSNYKYELSADVKPSFMKSLTNDVSVELESLNKDSIVLNIKNTGDSNIEEAYVSVLGIDASNNPVDMSSESISKKLNSEENDYVTINIDTDNIFKLKCFANASTSDDSETPSSDKVNNNVFEFSIRDELSSILSIDEMENIKLLEDKQGKAMNNGMFTLDDNWLYGLSFEARNPIFVKMRLDGSDYTVLADAAAENVCIKDGNIYFSTGDQRVGDSDGIFKVKTSGNDIENIKNVNQPDMRVSNDYIYYTSDNAIESENISMETNHLHRCKLDGSEDVDLIKTPVFCFYVFDNFILYQDDRDNESLHTFDLQSEKDTKLNDMKSYDPQLDGEKIYFRSHEGEDEFYTLWSMNIDGSDINKIEGIKCGSAFVLHDDKIYYSNAEDEYRLYSVNKDGTNINQVTQDNHVGNFYFEHGKLFYITYNNSYTDKCIMCDENGNNAINLFE